MSLRRSRFTMDSIQRENTEYPDITIEGYTDGETWNGWACPKFPLESVLALAQTFQSLASEYATTIAYDPTTENVIVHEAEYPGEPMVYEPEPVVLDDGREIALYGIGAGCWIWEEIALRREQQCIEGRERDDIGPEGRDAECFKPATYKDSGKCLYHGTRDEAFQQLQQAF